MKKALFSSFALLLATALCVFSQPLTRTDVKAGTVQGFEKNGLGYFNAIPFAEPPVGELRWKAPVPLKKWDGVLRAVDFGAMPPQQAMRWPGAPEPNVSEDCLYLNVITPASRKGEGLPVLVWIHGGGFITGDANSNEGDNFARNGIVFVSISYRTGALGFLSTGELSRESERGISGNYGLLDMIEALKWVKDNITAFGGDPSKVTIMGESAGAIAVSMLCASPLAKGLFRGAISESGGSFCPVDSVRVDNNGIRDLRGSEKFGEAFMRRIGVSSLSEMRKTHWDKWVGDAISTGVGGFWPTVDGYVLPDDQYKMYEQGNYNDVDILIGTNSDEGAMFCRPATVREYEVLVRKAYGPFADRILSQYPAKTDAQTFDALSDLFRETAFAWPTYAWANLQKKTGKGRVFMYYFDQFDPERPLFSRPGAPKPRGANHATELPYVFGHPWVPFSPSEKKVSDAMIAYWSNFVKYGDPNSEGLPRWPEYAPEGPNVMFFKDGTSLISQPNREKVELMEEFFRYKRESTVLPPSPDKGEADLFGDFWRARWISVPGTDPSGYGVYCFRKDVTLPSVPTEYPVHVTGDNRYKLYVNGILVSLGPAKGDATHWNYETVDLAPYLHAGKNAVSALLYHEGALKPDSQVSVSVGFLLQGEGAASDLYTDKTWKCIKDEGYSPVSPIVQGYYVAGPGERVDMALHIRDWYKEDYSTEGWMGAVEGRGGQPKNVMSPDQADGHNLIPSTLPQMELTPIRFSSLRSSTLPTPSGFPAKEVALRVPANTKAEMLLDQGELTNAYFKMKLGGGKGAKVSVGYAESLYIPSDEPLSQIPDSVLATIPQEHRSFALVPRTVGKGNRNEVEGKIFIGREDVILPDGTEGQEFSTLAWRTWRYVRVQVETASDPLTIEDIGGVFTGYPFTMEASLDTDDKFLQDVLSTGWRTARLCATETYMDCPYYEQLQYLGDTRIQALVTLFNSGDERLVRNFLTLSDESRNSDGITKSRYPTTITQYIQPYALSYVYALHDYMMYGSDPSFVMNLLPGAEQIMEYFGRYQGEDGRLRNLPGWNFSDWVDVPTWNYGAPLKGGDGCSVLMDMQLLYAYQLMAEMESERGNTYLSTVYTDKASTLSESIIKAYWSEERGLFSDRIEKDNYSQHAGALALLCGIAPDPKAMARRLLTDTTLAPCSVYYKFYLHQGLIKAGLADEYLQWLDIWKRNLEMGLSTWAEMSDINNSRSDCHAWGSSPNVELFRTVLGIDSDGVRFSRVRVCPHLGDIKKIGGAMPHPDGKIKVAYQRKGRTGIEAKIDLPASVGGVFVWGGKEYTLKGGENVIKIR